MGVNPQKIDTLLALCSNSNQKAAKILWLLGCFLRNFDISWRFMGSGTFLKIIESSRDVVICRKTKFNAPIDTFFALPK